MPLDKDNLPKQFFDQLQAYDEKRLYCFLALYKLIVPEGSKENPKLVTVLENMITKILIGEEIDVLHESLRKVVEKNG